MSYLVGRHSVSSSHALIGGLVGAGVTKAGTSAVVWSGSRKTAAAIVLSPLTGFLLALLLVLAVSWLFVRQRRVRSMHLSLVQFVSASLYSLGHGGNDAQKTMGIIAVLLFSQGHLGSEFHVPFWVVITCQAAMGLGTLFGGWRIVHTMGSRITRLKPMQGFCAETGGAITLVRCDLSRHSGFHHPYDHRRHRRRRRGAQVSAVRWSVAQQHRHRPGSLRCRHPA